MLSLLEYVGIPMPGIGCDAGILSVNVRVIPRLARGFRAEKTDRRVLACMEPLPDHAPGMHTP